MGLLWLLGGAIGGSVATALVLRELGKRRDARQRAVERRLEDAERLAEIGAMTGGLAHEIKNPLSTIGLNAQLLEEGLAELAIEESEKSRLMRRIGALRREVERLRGILTDFLQFAGQVRVDPRPTDLNQVVDELADFFLPQATRAGVRLRTELCPETLVVPVDVAHVKQAVLNLMINAVQAMSAAPPETPRELILRTRRMEPARGEPATAAIHVIDTGPGIAPEALGRIFKPYFTTKSGGTGLGLPTTKRLIEAHGGRIDVHTEVGRGTDFTIVLPFGVATGT